jgi:hypothetical protein
VLTATTLTTADILKNSIDSTELEKRGKKKNSRGFLMM